MMVIHKIGIVPLAMMRSEDGRLRMHVLIHKPKPKDGSTTDIAYGLARGTRMYFDAQTNAWHDARDQATAEMHSEHLEAPAETAKREMGEELDVKLEEFIDGQLQDMGVIHYESKQRASYPIHWFSGLVENPKKERAPVDAVAVKWVSLEQLRAMTESGEFKASYLPIVQAVMEKMELRVDRNKISACAKTTGHRII